MPVVYHRDRPWILSASGHPSLSMVVNREVGTSALSVWLANHEPGEDVPLHLHDVEEVLTFIEGEAEATLGNDTFPVRAGMSIIVPPGTPHGYRNTGTEPLVVIASLASPTAQRGRLWEAPVGAGA
jgi:mannose-6-phosphate isomerase-like protein (cupin superfamily)